VALSAERAEEKRAKRTQVHSVLDSLAALGLLVTLG
jgi:hypothetical protein